MFIVLSMLVSGAWVVTQSPAPASAQIPEECEEPVIRAPIEVTPAVGAPNVTRGAPIKVRYPEGYFEDPVIGADPATSILVFLGDDTGPEVPGYARAVGDTLVFTPDAPFESMTRYAGIAFGIDADFNFSFRTGFGFDIGPPTLGAILNMSSTRIEEDSCDALAGSYRVDVSFDAADDDGPLGDIEYQLYLSRGPEVDAPQLRARVRNQSTAEQIMAFIASPEEVASPICVSVIAVDGVGNVTETRDAFCDDPIQGSFFEPLCSAAPGAPGSRPGVPGALAFLAVLLLVIRRR
ncbi:MAG: hypothetical protein DRJ42_22705 [Deltaproteobacteria bacterium]|nr:MAG: hypothetical protein DRJ42_22705 [Deltaproteobacteria bacterium]